LELTRSFQECILLTSLTIWDEYAYMAITAGEKPLQ
jgi:hypothetical protein